MNDRTERDALGKVQATNGAIVCVALFLAAMTLLLLGLVLQIAGVPRLWPFGAATITFMLSLLFGIRKANARYLIALVIRKPRLRVLMACCCTLACLGGTVMIAVMMAVEMSDRISLGPLVTFLGVAGVLFLYAKDWLLFGFGNRKATDRIKAMVDLA